MFAKIKNSISQKLRYLIKLSVVLISDLYLKKFIQFETSSFESTSVSDDYILTIHQLKLNKNRLNGTYLKNRPFKIADSNIDQIIIPIYDYGSKIAINNVRVDIDNIDPDNPTSSYSGMSMGKSLILEAQRLAEIPPDALCAEEEADTDDNPHVGIPGMIRDILQDFANQFKLTIGSIDIHFRHLDIIFSFKNITCQRDGILFEEFNMSSANNIIAKISDASKIDWPRIDIGHIDANIPEMELIHSLKSIFSSSDSKSSSTGSSQTVSVRVNKIILRKNSVVAAEAALIYVQNLRTEIIKSDPKHIIHVSTVRVETCSHIILDANECDITFMLGAQRNNSSCPETEELFSESSTIYAGTVKPRTLKDKNIIYNYIRKQVWSSIVNININTLVIDNTNGIAENLIKSRKHGSASSQQQEKIGYRIQVSVNNIDVHDIQPEIDITGIRACVYIDPNYIIGLSRYVICTTHDTHLTDPVIVYSCENQNIGMAIKVVNMCLDKLISRGIPKQKKGPRGASLSQQDLLDLETAALFRSQQILKTPLLEKEGWVGINLNVIVVCESITLNYKLDEQSVSNYVLELNTTELYNVVTDKNQVCLNTTKVLCNGVITLESVHWKWEVNKQHNFSIDSISGILRPKDLSNLFPQNVQSKVKQKLKNIGEIKKMDHYFESEALQKFLEKVINPRDQDSELKRLDLVNIIPDYLTMGVESIDHLVNQNNDSLVGQLSIRCINMQFVQETGGPSCISLDIDRLKMEWCKDKFLVKVPNLRVRDYVDGSVWSNIVVTKDMQVTFVGGTLDITTPNRMYLNLDKRAMRFINNYSKDTKISQGKSIIRRIFTSHIEVIVSVKSTISLKDSKITITPMRIEGPNLSEKIILRLLMDNDKLAILLEGIKPLRPFVKIIRDGIAILNLQDRSGRTVTERIQKFLHTSAAEILELGAEIGSLPESERNKISFYANQPLNAKTGFTDAKKEFVLGIEAIMNLIKQKSKAGILDVPLIMIRPFTNSISKVMLGVLNEMDPERREIALNKY